jgi:uncharacterized protein YgfB (UPF0149 family)
MVSDPPFSDAHPDYERLAQLLVGAELAPTPAEAQGMLCGLLALHLPDALERWHAQLLAPPADAPAVHRCEESAHAHGADGSVAPLDLTDHGRAPAPAKQADGDAAARRAALDQLATWTQSAIAPPSVSFELLLPGEERPLHERANGVLDWVRGLLFGLALGGLERERLQGQAREAFDDLVELTRLDLESVAEDDADEQALTEIVEFLRIAAMLIREETAKTLPNAQAQQAHERGWH